MMPSSVRAGVRTFYLVQRASTSRGATRIHSVASVSTRRSLATAVSSRNHYTKEDVMNLLNKSQDNRNDMVYSISFGDDASFSLSSMIEPSALMQHQLQYSKNQLKQSTVDKALRNGNKQQQQQSKMDNSALPKTLEEVMRQKSRAIVVTETTKPFRVVDVNECWEGLCGYSFSEARGKTLGSLLKGPETDQVSATGLISHLLAGEEAGAVLINYTKEGREFRNRIRVGPLYDSSGKTITHFVGVLEELKEEQRM